MRFYTYAIMIVGIMMLLNLGGAIKTPVVGGLMSGLNLMNDEGNFTISDYESSPFYANDKATDKIKGLNFVLLVAVGAGIVLGSFGRAPDIRYVTAAFIFGITSALSVELISIFILVNGSEVFGGIFSTIISVIIGGLLTGLFITAIQFWQNPD
jgi:hypothetical protein